MNEEKTTGEKLREIFKGKSYADIETILESFLRNIKYETILN